MNGLSLSIFRKWENNSIRKLRIIPRLLFESQAIIDKKVKSAYRSGIRNILAIFCFLTLLQQIAAQPLGYYNGTESKSGNELKKALNEIISHHVDFSYSFSRNIINYSDADPSNPNNVILFYSQVSRDASQYGTGGDYINREHVWAKSHGGFTDIRPMYTDVHNLRPADASVNEDRSNKDFDNVQPNGIQDSEATACWYSDSAWEPGPLTKGQVARILFYMDTRYEGDNKEMDLKLVDKLNTYPLPEHGKLSTLLEWNRQYPPSDFERRRNERIFQIQQNRNPFIDHPEFADLIWNSKSPDRIQFANFNMIPAYPNVGDTTDITLKILSETEPDSIILSFGTSFDSEQNNKSLTKDTGLWSAKIVLNNFLPGEIAYFHFKAFSENDTFNYRGSYLIPEPVNKNEMTPITSVQGQGVESPLIGNTVTISGRVIANFDNNFYIQDNSLTRGGINVYGSMQTGKVGDSVIVRGTVAEYSTLTELSGIEYFYNYRDNKDIEPITINTSQINEDYEGMLVEIKNVTFDKQGATIQNTNSSYSFSDDFGSSNIFVSSSSRLVGKPLPFVQTSIVGVVSQYQGNYQILPRDIMDLAVTTSTINTLAQNNPVIIYPNPALETVHILSYGEIKSIHVFNINGVELMIKKGDISSFDISGLTPGIYITKIELAGNKSYIRKFSKL